MSWLSDHIEKRQHFHEKYPNGTQADWVKFCLEESMNNMEEEFNPARCASFMIDPHKIPRE